jgi:dTMP kinase
MTSPIPGGFLIALEGIDGAGKTTQAHMLESFCHVRQLACVRSKEPTNGKFGWILRQAAKIGRLPVAEELNICIQDRAEHVEAVIRPALAQNQIVILDRYYFSNAAYQGARGTSPKSILQMNERFAPHPDLLVILDIPPSLGIARIRERGGEPNMFETSESLARAREIFNMLEGKSVHRIDAQSSPEFVFDKLLRAFQVMALNKIFSLQLSPEGVERTREFSSEE